MSNAPSARSFRVVLVGFDDTDTAALHWAFRLLTVRSRSYEPVVGPIKAGFGSRRRTAQYRQPLAIADWDRSVASDICHGLLLLCIGTGEQALWCAAVTWATSCNAALAKRVFCAHWLC